MQLSARFLSLAAVLAGSAMAQSPMNSTSTSMNTTSTDAAAAGNSTANALLETLKSMGQFNTLAGLLAKYPEQAQALINMNMPLTLLAPVDSALAAAQGALGKLSEDQILATLQYHVIAGQVSVSANLTEGGHLAAPTLLNNATYVQLPMDMPQVVILTKDKSGNGMIYQNGKYIPFADSKDYTSGVLSLHPINGLLTIPGMLNTTLKAGNFSALSTALDAAKVSTDLEQAKGYTLFAPTDEAFKAVESALKNNSADVPDFLKGHVLEGTVAYGEDFQAALKKAMADDSAKLADGSYNLGNVTAANGAQIMLTADSKGGINLTSENTVAMITASDFLTHNGVVHGISKVFTAKGTGKAPDDAVTENNNVTGVTDTMASSMNGSSSGSGSGGAVENAAMRAVGVDLAAVSAVVATLSVLGAAAILL